MNIRDMFLEIRKQVDITECPCCKEFKPKSFFNNEIDCRLCADKKLLGKETFEKLKIEDPVFADLWIKAIDFCDDLKKTCETEDDIFKSCYLAIERAEMEEAIGELNPKVQKIINKYYDKNAQIEHEDTIKYREHEKLMLGLPEDQFVRFYIDYIGTLKRFGIKKCMNVDTFINEWQLLLDEFLKLDSINRILFKIECSSIDEIVEKFVYNRKNESVKFGIILDKCDEEFDDYPADLKYHFSILVMGDIIGGESFISEIAFDEDGNVLCNQEKKIT